MIVKNEEEHLPKCLESIKDQVDEIVVVDTGSSDKTKEIAIAYGAKVFEHPWENHFSHHRNQSIGYATGEWLFVIDGDEKLSLGNGLSLIDIVRSCNDVDSILVTVESNWQGGNKSFHNSVRLFKNKPNIHYEGRVHNEVVGIQTGKYMPIRIIHYGYNLDEEKKRKKFKRTVDLLFKDSIEDPENPRAFHYLGISYLGMNKYKDAIRASEKAIKLCRQHNNLSDLYAGSYYVASTAYMMTGNSETAGYWATEALKYYPMHLDALFILSKICFEKKDIQKFWKYVNDYLDVFEQLEKSPERFGTFIFQTTGFKWLAYLFRACEWIDEGLVRKGKKELKKSLGCCPDRAHYHHLIAGYYRQKKDWKKSLQEFNKALQEGPDRFEIIWDFVQFQKERNFPDDAEKWLKKLKMLNPGEKNILFELGNVKLEKNQFEESIRYYERVIKVDKNHVGARLNMSLALRKLERFEESIHHSLEVIKKRPSTPEGLSNLAYSYYALENYTLSAEYFIEIIRCSKDQLDAHVYLAHIFLLNGDVESCAISCDNILRILELDRDIVLNSIKDLGCQFLIIADRMLTDNQTHLSKICLEIGQILTPADSIF